MTLIAFFLPWVVVSCDGAPMATVSAAEAARGVTAIQPAGAVPALESGEAGERSPFSLPPTPGFWWLLVPGAWCAAVGLLMHVGSTLVDRRLVPTLLLAALTGIVTTVKLGMIDHLGVAPWAVGDIGVGNVTVELQIGVWFSLAGYVSALAGALAFAVFHQRLGELNGRGGWRRPS